MNTLKQNNENTKGLCDVVLKISFGLKKLNLFLHKQL
jgi:hypothetical protein